MAETNGLPAEPPDPSGGEGGGSKMVLSRSEARLLERDAKNHPERYASSPEERREAVEICINTWKNARTFRNRLAAVKAFATLDALNLKQDTTINVNVPAVVGFEVVRPDARPDGDNAGT